MLHTCCAFQCGHPTLEREGCMISSLVCFRQSMAQSQQKEPALIIPAFFHSGSNRGVCDESVQCAKIQDVVKKLWRAIVGTWISHCTFVSCIDTTLGAVVVLNNIWLLFLFTKIATAVLWRVESKFITLFFFETCASSKVLQSFSEFITCVVEKAGRFLTFERTFSSSRR